MRNIITLGLSLLVSSQALALEVVTSIKPIQLIANEITGDITKPKSIVSTNASPHDYALKPSDLKALQSADLVVWFGHGLEPFLESAVKQSKNVLQIDQIEGLELRDFDGDSHKDHHGHDHGSVDPHFWLGPDQVAIVSENIASQLSDIDPQNEAKYQANLAAFLQSLEKETKQIAVRLQPVSNKQYYVFHDAYGYFEDEFGLTPKGHFTVSPERKPGAKTLIKIRTALRNEDIACVFSEPQYTPAVVDSVMRGSKAQRGVLDPLAIDIAVEQGGYVAFLNQLATSYEECLTVKN
ncbi:zinc ABC transporter substrate-binding protein ZnuA [Vibrio maerlii]|uniref:zinc ABC transporter substrate-binding protein ZnuA n=1 Tax=Vibrio maerlii TaxID=2231648 RepID=UPI000E3BFC11|nr:zinc ABC transporter substrate-binding protein ZnuA [Vibrio maerlii]